MLVSKGNDGCGDNTSGIARQRHMVPEDADGAKSATSVVREIEGDGRGSQGLLPSPNLSARSHCAVKEFTGDSQVGNDLFLRIPSPMPANNLGIEVVLKFASLKLTA